MEFKQHVNKNQQISDDLLVGSTANSMDNQREEVQQAFAKVMEAADPSPRSPNYWERRYAAQKAAVPDTHGRTQKVNRNIAPAEKSLSDLMGVDQPHRTSREQANKSEESKVNCRTLLKQINELREQIATLKKTQGIS